MSDPLTAITGLCQRINLTTFKSPGIFTNAMISKPEVTSLIRDALLPEQNLYKITRRSSGHLGRNASDDSFSELRPERVDGKSTFVEPKFDDWSQTAVRVPKVVSDLSEVEALDLSSSPLKAHTSLLPQSLSESDDVSAMCDAITSVITQYPSLVNEDDLQANLERLRREYVELKALTSELELAVAEHRLQLDHYNDSINELLPSRGSFSPVRPRRDLDAAILREEHEIRLLEEELKQRTEERES